MFTKSAQVYSSAAVEAVRNGNVHVLADLKKAGMELDSSNKFGESLAHMACRRGYFDVLRYLVEEVGCDLKR